MKYLAWFVGIGVTVLAVVYVVAFTSFGNSLLKPTIEAKIREQTKMDSKLKVFSLNSNSFEILLDLNPNNSILVKGNYSLFTQAFNVAYRVDLKELKTLRALTSAQLQSSFYTDGTVVGDMASMSVDGKSDLASSATVYHVELTDLNPTSIVAKIDSADLKSLLFIANQKAYASAKINLDLNFKDITPHKLNGNVKFETINGKLNAQVMKKDFNVTIPDTAFNMKLDAKLQGDDVDYAFALNSNLAELTSSGKILPEPLALDIEYGVDVKELAVLKPMGVDARGAIRLSGNVKGDKANMKVGGKTDFASSDTSFAALLKNFEPSSVMATVKHLKLQDALYAANQKAYASAEVDMNVDFKNITPHKLEGSVKLETTNGKLNSQVMKKDFNVAIPATAFNLNLDAKLKGDDVDYALALNSNLAQLTSSGKIVPEPLAVDVKYGVDVKELAVLKPITGADLRGSLKLSGEAKGSKEKMSVSGKTDFASSDTTFAALLKNFEPSSVKATIKHLKLQDALYMANQPHFADALFAMDVDVSDARTGNLKGTVNSKITDGLADSKYITKAYEFKSAMPKTTFNATTTSTLEKSVIDTTIAFNSNLANLDVKRARFDTKDASLASDYIVSIANLDSLYFATDRHLKGSLVANGELKKAKDLDFTAHSDVAGGKVDAKLHNDDFHADIVALQTLDALETLIYPKVFKSSINGVLDYDLLKQSGVFNAKLSEGTFTQNQVLDLTKQFAKIDLYKQIFKGDVSANIKKENILASLDLKSNTSSIATKDTKLNSKTQEINSKIDISANGNPLVITLKGNASSPKVGIDAQKIIEKEATKAVEKELNKLFKKFF